MIGMPGGVIEVRRTERLGVAERLWFPGLLRAFGVVVRQFFRVPGRVAGGSPAPRPRPPFERSSAIRGMPVLVSDEGVSRCIGCALCAEICPPACIRVVPAASEASVSRPGALGAPLGPWQPPTLFEIDMARCFSCGLCEEVCPADALAMSPLVEIAAEDRGGLIFGFDALQVPASSLRDRVVPRSESGAGPSAALEVGP